MVKHIWPLRADLILKTSQNQLEANVRNKFDDQAEH